MSQKKRLKKPRVKGAERKRALRAAAAAEEKLMLPLAASDSSSTDPYPGSTTDREWLRRLDAERQQRSIQMLDQAAQEAYVLFTLAAQLRALRKWHSRKRAILLSAARFHERAYISKLELWLEIHGDEPAPESTPEWLAEDLASVRRAREAEQHRRAAAEASSARFAEELRSRYNVGDDDSFQEFAKRFIYDR
jgi:hypothetical protein